jgi:hypothetical protein
MGADAFDATFLMVTLSMAAAATAAVLWGGRRSMSAKAGAKVPAIHTGPTEAWPAHEGRLYHGLTERAGSDTVTGSNR